MPVIDIPLPDGREPGRTTSAYAWGPRFWADATNPDDGTVAVEVEFYATPAAAFAGGQLAGKAPFALQGREYRNWVRRNKALYLALIASVDAEIQARHGGTIVPGSLPAWADEPEESAPEAQPEPES